MMRVFSRGWWKPILIDDYVPVDEDNIPIALMGDYCLTDSKLDIWPNLVAKMLAKHYINYERLSKQGICELMRDLSGMPTKTYKVNRLEPRQLRQYWFKDYITIVKANMQFKKAFVTGKIYLNVHCGIRHIVELAPGKFYVQLKCYSNTIEKKTNFTTDQLLTISEDWKSVRPFTKEDKETFWVTWEEFQEYFSKAFISHYDEDSEYIFEKFSLAHSNKFAVNLEVYKTGPIVIEVDQLDKLFTDSSYSYSDVRMYVVSRSSAIKQELLRSTIEKGNALTSATLIKATVSYKTRTSVLEVDLKKGNYTLIIDCTQESHKTQADYILSVYYPSKSRVTMEVESNLVKKRAYLDMICSTAIQNGTKEYLSELENIRRYTFTSEKLHLFVYVYTNNTNEKHCVLDLLQIKGDYDCNIDLTNNYAKLYLPPHSKKAIIFRFKKTSKDFNVQI